MAEPTFYGAGQQTARNTTFRDKLQELFSPTDFVRVINIDDEPFTWQYLPSTKEKIDILPDFTKDTYREDPEVHTMAPAESRVLFGESAYIMIEGLYKSLAAKKVIKDKPNMQPGQARNFNLSDESAQSAYIKEIFLGKENPQFGPNIPSTPNVDDAALNKDLGLSDEPRSAPSRVGRPPKAATT